VVVVSHAYNGPGRIGPFAALGKRVQLALIGPREHPNGVLGTGEVRDEQLDVIALQTKYFGKSQFIMRGVAKSLRACRPDVVCVEYDPWHLQFLQVVLALKIARSRARVIPVVKKNTFREPMSILGRGKRALGRSVVRRASAIIAASELTRTMYIREFGAPATSIVVQPHLAVDVSRFRPRQRAAEPRPLRIGFVGKIGALKGVPELLTAFDETRRRSDVAMELWLAGSVTDRDLRASLSDAECVHHVGVIDNLDLHAFMSDLDVFVMPARVLFDHQEHDGRAVLEAMATGVPCVVSDSGILPELVSPEEGRVFPAGDAARLADSLSELAASPKLRRDLGEGARRRTVATVSPDVLSAERVALFNKIVEGRREHSRS
jgi:glycosyltransferase involved in cell wall biosynthesis